MKIIPESYMVPKPITLSILAIVLMASISATFYYPGTKILLIAYSLLSIAIVHATLINRAKSYFSFFLFSFLTLGCWTKIVFHLFLGNDFSEPIGNFDESPAAWDKAVTVLITAFSALLICYYSVAFKTKDQIEFKNNIVNSRFLPALLALMVLFTIGLLIFNYYFSILKIGYEPSLKLNSYIYVVVAFMVAWGNAIALSTLAYWMVANGTLAPRTLFYIVIIEGALTAFSMGSRAQMILHVAALFAIYLFQGKRLGWHLSKRDWIKIVCATALMFVFSILAVSADRLATFSKAVPITDKALMTQKEYNAGNAGNAGNSDTAPKNILNTSETALKPSQKETPYAQLTLEQKSNLIAKEISKLIVDRWLGIEGVLAVTSHQSLSIQLLTEGLEEDPAKGTQAIFQRMSDAKAKYGHFENFTFMTIPGPIALLFYSGSHLVLFVGVMLLFFLGYSIELATSKWLSNEMTNAIVGVGLAYLIVQMNFPIAFWFFIVELSAFLVGLLALKWTLNRLTMTTSKATTS